MRRFLTPGLLSLLLAIVHCQAITFYSTGDPSFNTTAPTGLLAGSGWQYQGQWFSDLGTPIAPNYFITAKHIGGTVGASFVYGGTTYTSTAFYDDPNSDLRIVQVNGTFSSYAPLYTGTSEVGSSIVMFGRGTQRGAAVTLSGTAKGWLWGTNDDTMRWGENTISAIYDGGVQYGSNLLGMTFSSDAGINEGVYSVGDSGGAVFILDGGTWKLAGINSYVDGPYGLTSDPNNNPFDAALFDTTGYWGDTLNGWVSNPGPDLSYATRISSSQAWIASVIPEPSTYALLGLGGVVFFAVRKRRIRAASK